MRRLISSKPETCTEDMVVYAAGISVKVSVHYPGRSGFLSAVGGLTASRGAVTGIQKSAEGILGPLDRTEGPNR